MKKALRWLLHPVLLGTLGLLALSAIVWWLAPLIGVGDSRPFAGLWVRVAILVVLWAAWIARLAYVAWQRKKTNAALLAGLGAGPSASSKEAQVLQQRFAEAVGKLKSSHGGSGVLGGGQFLYELPWYVFIGAPGSGKTTALLNAGLQFLLADNAKGALQGVGGTRNCEWWFTQDAVLIDTAGRYTTQESDRDVDSAAWDNFLALLKKTRPRQPINGVLLTVNIQDLLQQGAAERAQHAGALRARLIELRQKLGVRTPVYVLVTKADLIGGFNESFEALTKEERDQVFGFTFDHASTSAPGADALAAFSVHFQAVQQRLIEQLVPRLEGERDTMRRAAMFAFPQELAALQAVLGDFLRAVVSGGGKLEEAPLLRGVYFTSGTQEGSPIDRVMGALGRSFGIDTRSAPVQGRGKSFFLHRLLKEVVFAERGLGARNPVAERRRRVLRASAMSAMGLVSVALVAGWFLSRARNLDHAAQVADKLPAVKQAVEGLPPATTADVTPLPGPLMQVRDAARIEGLDIADPPLLNGLGLYQGDKLDAGARIAYQRLLQKTLMPRVARRLEERLRSANSGNLEDAYEALKSYLMLHTPSQFDADALKAWIAVDWDANLGKMPPEQRAALDAHLDALLALGAPRAAVAKDDALVANVREMLVSYPLEYRVYSRIKRSYKPGQSPDFTAAGAAGPNAQQVFQRVSGEPLTRGISGLYTKEGFRRLVQPAVTKLAPQLAREEVWVLGLRDDPARLRDATVGTGLSDKVKRAYFGDYIKVWDAYLADVKLVPLKDPERALAVSRLLSSPDSPLAAFLRGVSNETKLVEPPPTGALDKAAADVQKKLAAAAGAAPAGPPVEKAVDDHFANIHRQLVGEPPPINATLKLFGEVYAHLAAVDAAKKSKSPPPPGAAMERLKVDAAQQPPIVSGMVEQLADAAVNQGRGAEMQGLSAELQPITEFCNRAITGRYPFATGTRADVLPDDFGQLFGGGGMFDDFFQRRLASLVDTGAAAWVYRPLADGSKPVASTALADFQRAQRIREVFFRAGGKVPSIKLELRLSEIDPALKELTLDIDGQQSKLTSGGASVPIAWPSARLASRIEITTGLGAAGPKLMQEGPWALFRLFDSFQVQPGPVPERFSVVMNLDGKRVRLEVFSASVFNPFQLREIRQFRCPTAL
ncbi:MAG: type VI secretion system membrane subunit TssM [Rubrivivax sp.]